MQELARVLTADAMLQIWKTWPITVGETIAANAWPARVARDGTLHVAATSSTWAFELSLLAPQILERLRETLAEAAPSGLRFALGHVPERSEMPLANAGPQPPRPSPEHVARASEIAAAHDHDGLRDMV